MKRNEWFAWVWFFGQFASMAGCIITMIFADKHGYSFNVIAGIVILWGILHFVLLEWLNPGGNWL